MCWEQSFFVLLLIFISGCSTEIANPRNPATTSETTATAGQKPAWGGLKVQFAGAPWQVAPNVVILLHGYGASGSDLLPLSGILGDRGSTAFLFPEAPIPIGRNEFAWSQQSTAEYQQSREQVIQLIKEVRQANPQCRISVGGFSQGATIACNLLSDGDPPLASVILFSPNPLLFREPIATGDRPKVYLAHGRSDAMIPFSDVETLKSNLESKGYQVTWNPFAGGHEITMESLFAVKHFLSELPANPAATNGQAPR